MTRQVEFPRFSIVLILLRNLSLQDTRTIFAQRDCSSRLLFYRLFEEKKLKIYVPRDYT